MTTRTRIHVLVICALIVCVYTLWRVVNTEIKPKLELSSEEKLWLDRHQNQIIVAPDPMAPPIDMFNAEGKHIGLSADYLKIIQNQLNTSFIIQHLPSWKDVLENAESKDISIVSLAMRTPERETYLNFTTPIVNVPNVIIVRNNTSGELSLNDLNQFTVSVPENYAIHEYLKTNYKDLTIKPAKNTLDGLQQVSFGEADAAVVDLGQASYFTQKHSITNLRVAGRTPYELNLSFAVRKDWPELISILNKTIQSIPNETRSQIFHKWIGLDQSGFWENPEVQRRFVIFSLCILLLVLASTTWNLSLRRAVYQKTLDMHLELEKRKQIEQELFTHKENLEETVAKRTQQLEKKNTELELARSHMERLSITDTLTGLKNRRYLQQTIRTDVARILREHNIFSKGDSGFLPKSSIGFIMLDIDYFKSINDNSGHDAGDKVLVQLSNMLLDTCRSSDSVIRWGGEEFLIIARSSSNERLSELTERIRNKIGSHLFELGDGKNLNLTCSIGYAIFPQADDNNHIFSWEQTIGIADRLLYIAKLKQRNAWVGLPGGHTLPENFNQLNSNEIVQNAVQGKISIETSIPAARFSSSHITSKKPTLVRENFPRSAR